MADLTSGSSSLPSSAFGHSFHSQYYSTDELTIDCFLLHPAVMVPFSLGWLRALLSATSADDCDVILTLLHCAVLVQYWLPSLCSLLMMTVYSYVTILLSLLLPFISWCGTWWPDLSMTWPFVDRPLMMIIYWSIQWPTCLWHYADLILPVIVFAGSVSFSCCSIPLLSERLCCYSFPFIQYSTLTGILSFRVSIGYPILLLCIHWYLLMMMTPVIWYILSWHWKAVTFDTIHFSMTVPLWWKTWWCHCLLMGGYVLFAFWRSGYRLCSLYLFLLLMPTIPVDTDLPDRNCLFSQYSVSLFYCGILSVIVISVTDCVWNCDLLREMLTVWSTLGNSRDTAVTFILLLCDTWQCALLVTFWPRPFIAWLLLWHWLPVQPEVTDYFIAVTSWWLFWNANALFYLCPTIV